MNCREADEEKVGTAIPTFCFGNLEVLLIKTDQIK